MELSPPLIVQILTAAVTIGTLYGMLKTSLKNAESLNERVESDLKEDIARLEKKMDKHNNIVERLTKVEERSKSNSHRIDKMEVKE